MQDLTQPRKLSDPGPGTEAINASRPVLFDLTMFMAAQVTCPACRMARRSCGKPEDRRLHVCRRRGTLVITEADDLHHPGSSLVASHVQSTQDAEIYRIDGVRAPDRSWKHAEGIVTLSWANGNRHVKVVGTADGFDAHDGIIFDAIEHR